MSGLEPLVALGLACNTLQLVGTGRETIRTVRQIYQDGKLDSALSDRVDELKSLAQRASAAFDSPPVCGYSCCDHERPADQSPR